MGMRASSGYLCCAVVCGALVAASSLAAQAPPSVAAAPTDGADWHRLNEVVAVVNRQVVLASDVDDEMRLVHLLPGEDAQRQGAQRQGASGQDGQDQSAAGALERLITRVLIEQQIRIEDPAQLEPDAGDVEKSLIGLRQDLPACKLTDCMTDAGWADFLAGLNLTPAQVASYWKERYAVLGFIEQRFKSGIRISPQEVADYYHKTLLPLYRNPQDAPPLATVSSRIQEILLQERVNLLIDDWVQSLRGQGKIEIVDSSLRAAVLQADEAAKARAASEKKLVNGESAP